MTSSSDAGRWQPLELAGVTSSSRSAGSAFVPKLVPALSAGEPDATPGAASWLPSLRTTTQLSAERVREGIEREAHGRGLAEGTRTERERADERCATALEAVARAADHLESIRAEFAQDRERDLQALAIAVARQIVQHELTIDPLRVGELVRRALDLLPLDHSIEIRMNPADLHTLAPSLEGLRPEGRQVVLQWVGDASIDAGGFVAESPHRIVDGRVDVALRAIYERLDHD